MGAGQQRDTLGQVSTCHSVTLLRESQARHWPTTVTKVLCLKMAPCTGRSTRLGGKDPGPAMWTSGNQLRG